MSDVTRGPERIQKLEKKWDKRVTIPIGLGELDKIYPHVMAQLLPPEQDDQKVD